MSEAVQAIGKNQLLNRSACKFDLLFRTRTLKSSNCCIRTFWNSSSAAIIVFLVYSVMWCLCEMWWFKCSMACSVMVPWLTDWWIQFYQVVVFYSFRQACSALKQQIIGMQGKVKIWTWFLWWHWCNLFIGLCSGKLEFFTL